jgi:hypothetical protein
VAVLVVGATVEGAAAAVLAGLVALAAAVVAVRLVLALALSRGKTGPGAPE